MGELLHVIRNVSFNREDYLNGISSKHPVPAKQNTFPNIISL